MLVSGKHSPTYRLGPILGQGAMGVVYRADELDTTGVAVRAVAIKLVRPDLPGPQPALAERFRREIGAAALLRGNNTVTVYHFGETSAGQLFYVMELLSGQTLHDILEESGRLPALQLVSAARQICTALAEAHALPQPVIHCDLKPANVLIERWQPEPWVKVSDFGVARILGEGAGTHLPEIPAAGGGTPRYMSPEQCRGERVDARSDLYALGIILYEGLSGRAPFVGDPHAVMWQQCTRSPEPLPPSVPKPLRDLVGRLLEKDAAHRPPDAAQVGRELAAVAGALHPADATPAMARRGVHHSPRSWRRVHWLAAFGVGLAMLVALAGALWDLVPAARPGTGPGELAGSSGIEPAQANPRVRDGRTHLAVLRFRNLRDADAENEWIGNALQASLTTALDKVDDIRVVSRDSVDEAGLRSGSALEVARVLGAEKLLVGSFAVYRDQIRIDAWLIDAGSGLHEMAETAQGTVDEFFKLQAGLALAMLKRLPVAVGREVRESIERGNASENPAAALDAYRLMLQGEGLDGEDGEDTLNEPQSRRAIGAAVALARGVWSALGWPTAALADEVAGEADVRQALESYRSALERGDIEAIRATRGGLSSRRRAGLEQYFNIADDLRVEFGNIELTRLSDDRYNVLYVRRDEFADRRTGERVVLEVRLENIAVRDGNRWILRDEKGGPGL